MITSLNNERIKHVRALQSRRRARDKAGQYVIEGATLLEEAHQHRVEVDEIFYTEAFTNHPKNMALLEALSQAGASLTAVADDVMDAMSDTVTPQGVLGVLPSVFPAAEDTTFSLIIDAISDPGNLGTIMRTAAAAGVQRMITTPGTVDVLNPKVIRGGMGAHFRLPVVVMKWESIREQLDQQVIFLADTHGGGPYYNIDWTQPCALIISEEAHGPSQSARTVAHAYVTIPMPGEMESLNAAIAAGVLLFEMVRQRTVS